MLIDDLAGALSSRGEARTNLDEQLNASFETGNVSSIRETPQEREARLRPGWGHDPASQNQWRR